ncbi:ribonuclease HII [Bacillaceae bacterium IKA-2]|nr:ribonuclease HII [Bacillaceae bacterium IKA-2]
MMKRSIKEIAKLLQNKLEISEDLLNDIKSDERKGIQKQYTKWLINKDKQKKLESQFKEMSKYEQNLWGNGTSYIAGIDEVGRGPLAGPVVAAAVILPKDFLLLGLTDSKKVTKINREDYYQKIYAEAISIGIGFVESTEIDRINIYQATKLAMEKAIRDLAVVPDHLLIDAMQLTIPINQSSIIKGDNKSISIAAGSIIAKVTRDRYMEQLAEQFPHYGFERHMGYGTREHLIAIQEYGICEEHRKSFAPVREVITNKLF